MEPEPEPEPEQVAAHAGPEDQWRSAVAGILGDEGRCDVTFVVGGERLHALRHLCAVHSEVFGAFPTSMHERAKYSYLYGTWRSRHS